MKQQCNPKARAPTRGCPYHDTITDASRRHGRSVPEPRLGDDEGSGCPGLKFAVFSAESYSALSPAYQTVLYCTDYTMRNDPAEILIRGDVVEVRRDVGKRQRW